MRTTKQIMNKVNLVQKQINTKQAKPNAKVTQIKIHNSIQSSAKKQLVTPKEIKPV